MSTRGHAVLQDLSYKLGSRTVQVTVSPRPAKFAERRAVLHSLQKFARVEVFKKLNDNSSFISVLADKAQAKSLVNMSPLQYQIAIPRLHGSVQMFLTNANSPEPIIKSKASESAPETETTRPAAEEDHKEFTVHIFPAESYIHAAAIRSSPLHGPWPESRRETTMMSTLKETLPKNIMTEGLADWETGGQIPASEKSQLWEDILLGSKSTDVSTRAIIDRIQRRERRNATPPIMDGLLQLREKSRNG
ncbi:hypothetical protein K4K56_006878 [Colletotrichum sp. SAR 10_98]|nr:hypothetical protein K4K55_009424 [Colletotrichum sp. SAR 10_96]KAI8258873.1 hypothetical protein K4K56_006878 [Colletotrichum sp. SAR 10_98]